MHSDWLIGYMIKYYLLNSNNIQYYQLDGIETYPFCGNYTSTGSVRPCNDSSISCHMQTPKDMETLSLSMHAQAPDTFPTDPRLEETSFEDTINWNEHVDLPFPPVYWINLDRSTQRRQAMLDSFSSLGINNTHRVSASNVEETMKLWQSGQLVFHPKVQLEAANDDDPVPLWEKHGHNIYHQTEAACLLSHLNAIKQAYEDDHDLALIIEDDAKLSETFRDELMGYITMAPKGWKMLQFATNHPDVILQGSLLAEAFVSWQAYHWSTRAYLINRSGMQIIMDRLHSTTKEGHVIWSLQDEPLPMVVADEVVYAMATDTYTATALWIDANSFESTVQMKSDKVSSWSSYSSAGDMSVQLAMKKEVQVFDESLLVIMTVRISKEDDIQKQIRWILQDIDAVCKYHPICEWKVNILAINTHLLELYQEASTGMMPSNIQYYSTVRSDYYNKFAFVRDVMDTFESFDLLLFKV